MPKSEVYNCDCMTFMQGLKDNAFDLCIADPPYGIDINSSGRLVREKGREYKGWDKGAPDSAFFREMMRVSRNQIIWGANHFISQMPLNSSSWVVWDKKQPENLSFAMCELAWTSSERSAKIFRYSPSAQTATEEKIHPTQKPIALYEWLLKNYAPQGGGNFRPYDGQSVEPHCSMANGV